MTTLKKINRSISALWFLALMLSWIVYWTWQIYREGDFSFEYAYSAWSTVALNLPWLFSIFLSVYGVAYFIRLLKLLLKLEKLRCKKCLDSATWRSFEGIVAWCKAWFVKDEVLDNDYEPQPGNREKERWSRGLLCRHMVCRGFYSKSLDSPSFAIRSHRTLEHWRISAEFSFYWIREIRIKEKVRALADKFIAWSRRMRKKPPLLSDD